MLEGMWGFDWPVSGERGDVPEAAAPQSPLPPWTKGGKSEQTTCVYPPSCGTWQAIV
jgi:hypothetical protein